MNGHLDAFGDEVITAGPQLHEVAGRATRDCVLFGVALGIVHAIHTNPSQGLPTVRTRLLPESLSEFFKRKLEGEPPLLGATHVDAPLGFWGIPVSLVFLPVAWLLSMASSILLVFGLAFGGFSIFGKNPPGAYKTSRLPSILPVRLLTKLCGEHFFFLALCANPGLRKLVH